ncbi:root phototropism protein 3-like, partial [Trifolium pratense]
RYTDMTWHRMEKVFFTTKTSSKKYYLWNKFEFPGLDKTTMKILDCERVLDGGKRNRCVVLPANVPMVADSLKRKNQNWIARANSANDLIIQVGDSSFHLHKLAMVSRSEYLNRLVFKKRSNIEENTSTIQIDNIPVLQCYVLGMSSDSAAKVHTVGRLVDGYLSQVARDQMLKVESFKLLVEVLPQNARECDDNLYKVIDMYLKARPYLTEEDRENVCSILEYHRLSQEARQHVMKNDRLPLKLSTGFVLLEQVSMSWTVASKGSNYQRTKTQTSMRVSKDFENIQMNQEIKVMRKDVEMMKSQLLELNTCKMKLQKQMKICTR